MDGHHASIPLEVFKKTNLARSGSKGVIPMSTSITVSSCTPTSEVLNSTSPTEIKFPSSKSILQDSLV
ncbi:hypothetical protein GBA52_026818 [Prunus armeniaca]|nr:hypothetical protein GBA52_026818 [Prunus armeniaca]